MCVLGKAKHATYSIVMIYYSVWLGHSHFRFSKDIRKFALAEKLRITWIIHQNYSLLIKPYKFYLGIYCALRDYVCCKSPVLTDYSVGVCTCLRVSTQLTI